MYLYFQFTLKPTVRKEEAFGDLQAKIESFKAGSIENLIASTVGTGFGILEVNVPTIKYNGNGYSFNMILVDSVKIINIVAAWAEFTADYTMAINDFSVVAKAMETIGDKSVDTLLKTVLLSTGAKAIIGEFNTDSIPHDENTLELL